MVKVCARIERNIDLFLRCEPSPLHLTDYYYSLVYQGIQLGPTEASNYWIYWVPAQYVEAVKEAILGKWQYFWSESVGVEFWKVCGCERTGCMKIYLSFSEVVGYLGWVRVFLIYSFSQLTQSFIYNTEYMIVKQVFLDLLSSGFVFNICFLICQSIKPNKCFFLFLSSVLFVRALRIIWSFDLIIQFSLTYVRRGPNSNHHCPPPPPPPPKKKKTKKKTKKTTKKQNN